MQRLMLKSKIHRATLTGTEIDYEGSIAIDSELLKRADILPGEQVHVLNVNNGSRLVTYAIPAKPFSGTIMLNGPAARLGTPGDIVVIISYALFSEKKLKTYSSKVIFVDGKNKKVKEK